MAGDTLQFLDYRKPKLESGDYTFEVTQTYGDPDGGSIPITKSVKVKVQGDRIRINPDQIFAKYPPEGEQGNFTDTIPHIALKKPTLPWERSAYTFDTDTLYKAPEETVPAKKTAKKAAKKPAAKKATDTKKAATKKAPAKKAAKKKS